jgi:hypothetical protein
MASARPDRAQVRAELAEKFGELFDFLLRRDIRGNTLGEQAERSRRRERFQLVALELGRELVRAVRRSPLAGHPGKAGAPSDGASHD